MPRMLKMEMGNLPKYALITLKATIKVSAILPSSVSGYALYNLIEIRELEL